MTLISQFYPCSSVPVNLDPSLCLDYPPFNPSIAYFTSDTLVNVSWSASDNVGIREYYFALSLAENYTQDPTSLTYYPTASHPHYSIHDPSVLVGGATFYLSVRAMDHALHETRLDIGPLRVDISPPLVNGSVRVEQVEGGEGVRVIWEEGTFLDPEDLAALVKFEYAVGEFCFIKGN